MIFHHDPFRSQFMMYTLEPVRKFPDNGVRDFLQVFSSVRAFLKVSFCILHQVLQGVFKGADSISATLKPQISVEVGVFQLRQAFLEFKKSALRL